MLQVVSMERAWPTGLPHLAERWTGQFVALAEPLPIDHVVFNLSCAIRRDKESKAALRAVDRERGAL